MDIELSKKLYHEIERLIPRVTSQLDPEHASCAGGWFYHIDGTEVVAHVEIGTTRLDWPSCRTHAKEKAERLAKNSSHTSSRQSRDVGRAQYGGAIRAGRHILSFSGYPELWDEALMLAAAYRVGLIKMSSVQLIASPDVLRYFDILTGDA